MKQPNWKRWEVILLVDMYYRVKDCPEKVSIECMKLSHFLRRSNLELALHSNEYRNYEGIRMKYQNIRHIVEGKGLSAHSKLDVEIVNYYEVDASSFRDEVNQILNCQ